MTEVQILVVVVAVSFVCVYLYRTFKTINEKVDAINRYEKTRQRHRDKYNHYWAKVVANYDHNSERVGRIPQYDAIRIYVHGDVVSYKGVLYKAIEPPYWADLNLGKTPNENCI